MKRRLAAIFVADVAGCSSLMEADEEGTAARMGACRAIADAEGDDLIGDGVNLAARIQQAAEPGAIDLSGALFEQMLFVVSRSAPRALEGTRVVEQVLGDWEPGDP